MARTIRLAAVSFTPPAIDHTKGINLAALRTIIHEVAAEKPNFICFPELCACGSGGGAAGFVQRAVPLKPFADEVGKLAREVGIALVVPVAEKAGEQVYNSVPIVDSKGQLVLVYRKNYPTDSEMKAGITPGTEVPVGVCDGVRVGAAVCFDCCFPQVWMELEANRARVVFWPSMYWGGNYLRYYAARFGYYVVVAYNGESAIVDMRGQHLVRQGQDSYLVKRKKLPPWAVAEVAIDREVYHLDYNQDKFAAIRKKYGPGVDIETYPEEDFCLMTSRLDGTSVEQIAAEFQLETMREYFARSTKMREQMLRTHARKRD
jgi:predicted amidohydrolase